MNPSRPKPKAVGAIDGQGTVRVTGGLVATSGMGRWYLVTNWRTNRGNCRASALPHAHGTPKHPTSATHSIALHCIACLREA